MHVENADGDRAGGLQANDARRIFLRNLVTIGGNPRVPWKPHDGDIGLDAKGNAIDGRKRRPAPPAPGRQARFVLRFLCAQRQKRVEARVDPFNALQEPRKRNFRRQPARCIGVREPGDAQ